ncbi:hypothetical protein CKF54_03725 [Psittacicella hinzii]|uniref:Uncharacterized protein n=1 Tax=Psittacicella hinzii TaxID=2028575 RepID=A0A3A1Y5Z8_9GAMM|nr:hypothetical protein [Psittacicella hinzii]RIY32921.1 hypothetical protein CKF54_03725 [Psittacicella hinzii]
MKPVKHEAPMKYEDPRDLNEFQLSTWAEYSLKFISISFNIAFVLICISALIIAVLFFVSIIGELSLKVVEIYNLIKISLS